ncbi:MAG TPA: DUF1080 domain-containing protein [Tepidisphaeraceae bacterium]|nr:DUF1080 domain-containing protein [Tepidisphaeraceae bacterium]
MNRIVCSTVAGVALLTGAFSFAADKPAVPAQPAKPAAAPEDEKIKLPAPGPDGFVQIFNGTDLAMWYGDMSIWKVDNGEIVGKSEKGLKKNDFLKSKFEVGDFRLIVDVKLTPNTANSGIQFRSIPWKGHEMKGYQADMGKGWWGKIYEESGRGLLAKKDGDAFVKPGEWNTYEIVAVGPNVLTALNGNLCSELEEDREGARVGIFGLQVHSGGPTEVRFKNLRLELKPKLELVTAKKDGEKK